MTGPLHALIVGASAQAGIASFYHHAIRSAPFVIAADGGLSLCDDAGRVPDVCIGDFDSVDPEALARAGRAGAEIRRFPVEKDVSDLDLALTAARGLGPTTVDFTAAFSGRIDHTLAAFGTLLSAADLEGRALEPGFTAYALAADSHSGITLAVTPPSTISVFAIDGPATLSIEGVRYPLSDGRLTSLSALGLSNEAVAPAQRIDVSQGRCVVIVAV